MSNIGVVIVTYNRLSKLKKTLECYLNQTKLPEYIIVVNNASKDGTKEYLEEWKKESSIIKKYVINVKENTGGSGGFFIGEEKALTLDADWILVADDDAYPHSNYIEIALKTIDENKEKEISAICGKVIEYGDLGHRFYLNSFFNKSLLKMIPKDDYNSKYLFIDAFGYVGPIINKNKMKKVGLINKDFFIWADDLEHSLRLRKVGYIICCPKLVIEHEADKSNYILSWKDYYGVRNNVYLFKTLFPSRFPFLLIKELLKIFIKSKSLVEIKMKLVAFKDGVLGNLGKHIKYKPGWKR